MEQTRLAITRRLRAIVSLIVVVGAVALLDASAANAVPAGWGVISGRVMECGPGPIIVSPPTVITEPKPVVVRVLHDGLTYAIKVVLMDRPILYSGKFRFHVPAGTYEVLSSYNNLSRWVVVSAGKSVVVHFAPFACPMMTSTAPS
jgi:hypothetical protein